jgi:hypothetical protein
MDHHREEAEALMDNQLPGLIQPGNIDLRTRPVVRNPDGSISTVRTISIGTDQGEVLIPTVGDEGRILSDEDAIRRFHETGKHFGIFSDADSATQYAQQLHLDQEREYVADGAVEFEIAAPDGKTFTVKAPPGTTREQVMQRFATSFAAAQGQRESQAQPLRAGPPRPDGPFDLVPGPGGRLQVIPALQPAEAPHFFASLKSSLVEDEETKRRLIAQELFPGDPKGIDRVGFFEGVPAYVDDNGVMRRVSPGMVRLGAEFTANLPETVGGTVGAGAGVGGAVAGATGMRGIKRAVAGLVFDEPQTIESNLADLGTEAVLNLATAGIGKGVAKFSGRGRIVDFTPENVRTAAQAREYIKQATGIDVDLAQASGNRKLIAIRGYAARFPGKSAELIQAADEAANGQLDAAVNRVMNLVSSATPMEIGATKGVNAAQMAITAARQRVQTEVAPLYQAAYDAVPQVTDARILNFLKLPYFREAFTAGQKLRALETRSAMQPSTRTTETIKRGTPEEWASATTTTQSTPTGAHVLTSRMSEGTRKTTADGVVTTRADTVHRDITHPSLAELDYTKRALDARIESLMQSGERQRARALTRARNDFVAALDALPNQEWRAARERYGVLAQQVIEPLENSIVGVLAKIENAQAARVAAKVLGDRNVEPDQIRWAAAQIRAQDPSAWDGLVRQYIGSAWNKALKETQTAGVVNPAGKLRQALIGTPRDKARMQAMLPAGAVQAFDDLMTAAESLARTPIAGSNTMRDTEIRDQLKGQGAVAFRWLTQPRQSVIGAAEQRALEQNTVAVTEAILNPAKQKQLRQIVKMAPSTRKAILISSLLSGQVAASGTAAAGVSDRPQDHMPELIR